MIILCSFLSFSAIMCRLWKSYAMDCPSEHGDNPLALASRLSLLHIDNHGYNYFILRTSVLTLHIMRYFVPKLVGVV